jgi:hypothetical protein
MGTIGNVAVRTSLETTGARQTATGPFQGVNGTITSITATVISSRSGNTIFAFGIWIDNGGVPGNLVAYTGTISGGDGMEFNTVALNIVSPSGGYVMSSGNSYWFGVITSN